MSKLILRKPLTNLPPEAQSNEGKRRILAKVIHEFHMFLQRRYTESVDGLYLCMMYSSQRLQALGNGATFKEISKKNVEESEISPNSSRTKTHCCHWLKWLMLSAVSAQGIHLADDFLRAVFINMFGDPVTNPKGWLVRPLSELVSICFSPLCRRRAKGDRFPAMRCGHPQGAASQRS